jgi:hypothetical protein
MGIFRSRQTNGRAQGRRLLGLSIKFLFVNNFGTEIFLYRIALEHAGESGRFPQHNVSRDTC